MTVSPNPAIFNVPLWFPLSSKDGGPKKIHNGSPPDFWLLRVPGPGSREAGAAGAAGEGEAREAGAGEPGAGACRARSCRVRVRTGFCAASPGLSHGLQPPPLPCLLSSRVLISLRWHGGGGGGGGARGGGGGGGEQLIIVMVAAAAAAAAAQPSVRGCSPRGVLQRTSPIYFCSRLGLAMCLLPPARGFDI
ncbi:uncharacterized protein LOC131480864 [Ochotona princeps]|uniref:uncharacterized protein LOC131480864 n=1 Tax=Ochotona princeps TaxID=9978 RepID=UPI0027148BFC|nr:uncharacterized protein LOC131480864 [Ochotona princeps]